MATRVNKDFIPNEPESRLISIIQSHHRGEFGLIRLSKTMLGDKLAGKKPKYIIDANFHIRNILKDAKLVDFSTLEQGKENKREIDCKLIHDDEIKIVRTSLYRPKTKSGDPRFWPSRFNALLTVGTLVYFTNFNGSFVAIPLVDNGKFEETVKSFFLSSYVFPEKILDKLKLIIKKVVDAGWIESVSTKKRNDKDVGETFEDAIGEKANNLKTADFENQIELKTKREKNTTKDTLFSCSTPTKWHQANMKSVLDVTKKYGSFSKKHPESPASLYCTITNVPNPEGLYLKVEDKKHCVTLCGNRGSDNHGICSWDFSYLKKRVWEKHPATAWLLAGEKIIDGKIHFKYHDVVNLTCRPIFSQFIELIRKGVITYDIRGHIKPSGTAVRSHGNPFRISKSRRDLLFGESYEFKIK